MYNAMQFVFILLPQFLVTFFMYARLRRLHTQADVVARCRYVIPANCLLGGLIAFLLRVGGEAFSRSLCTDDCASVDFSGILYVPLGGPFFWYSLLLNAALIGLAVLHAYRRVGAPELG